MHDQRPSCRVGSLDRITTVKKHGVPEQDIAFPGKEALLFESFGLPGNPIVVTPGSSGTAGMQVRLRVVIELGKPW